MASKRLLIIDDIASNREVTRLVLEMLGGWEVVTACSGQKGLEKAATHYPDAILLDVMRPGMDGPTVFQKLQTSPATCSIPVIFLTDKICIRRLRILLRAGDVQYPGDFPDCQGPAH